MTIALRTSVCRIAGFALAVLAIAAALPAVAATITIKNCTNSTQRIELRPGSGTQDEGVAIWVVDIFHTRSWSGSCGVAPTCWVKVRPQSADEANTLSSSEICLLIPTSSRPVTTSLGDCGCS